MASIRILAAALLFAAMAAPHPAEAQRRGGPAAAPAARPAMSAPRMSAPRMSVPRMSAPRMSAPRYAPAPAHRAMPRYAAPPRAMSPRAMPPRSAGRPAPQWRPRAAERRQMRIEQRALRRQDRVAQRPDLSSPQPRAERRARQRQLQTQERRQLRQLQARQRQDLRGRSPAERRQLRARQREQVQTLRAEQRQQRRQALQDTGRNQLAGDPRRGERAANAARIEAARQGRFTSRFHNGDRAHDRAGWRDRRYAHAAARHAWRHGRRAAFVAWLGPVFYPYAYSDIFEYTFWPYAYDEAYWAYMYDDFFDGVFFGYENPYVDYYEGRPSYAGATAGVTGSAPPSTRRAIARGTPVTAQLCNDPGHGVTAWPFAQIAQAVKPDEAQKALLDELKRAAAEAAAAFKASCEEDVALTPTGRLSAMTRRVEATLRAVRSVRPALDAFYNALSDEQKARFTAMGPDELGADARKRALDGTPQADAACGDVKPGLVDLPMSEIEETLKPTEAQREAFDRLSLATASATELLQAACPDTIPLTPSGRLEAMEKRLDALAQAARTVRPALEDFYASLTNEQKARFNTLGRQARRVN